MPKRLLNAPEDAVVEMLEGLVATVPHLRRLDGFPEVKVVFDAGADPRAAGEFSRVALISGGGSGHEPAHAGYVGQGMLTAAVCGDVFASPSTAAVLAAIRQVTGPAGCLLIVKNYTGDRLHFGLAAEKAKHEGFKVEVVVVADDCALEAKGIAGRRGIAGTVFVHKVAGAAAAAGLSLAQVKAEAEAAASSLGSMGIATSSCTLPGSKPSDRLGPDEMELGLGIHGEPGAATAALQSVDEIIPQVLERIVSQETGYLALEEGDRLALLVNSLGSTSLMELHIAARAALCYLHSTLKVRVERVYVGPFMTALDMAGLSLSLLKVDDERLSRLDAPTQAPGWPSTPAAYITDKEAVPVPVGARPSSSADAEQEAGRPEALSDRGAALEDCIGAASEAVEAAAEELDEMDARVGDGDCGATLKRAAVAILEDLDASYPLNDPAATAAALGRSVARSTGGTSGALYDIFFTAAAASARHSSGGNEAQAWSLDTWAMALHDAVAAVQRYGGAQAGHRTMLDALLPASEALMHAASSGRDCASAFEEVAAAAEAGAEQTKYMAAGAGRSSYVPEDTLRSIPDPGAKAVALWLRAVADALHT